MKIKTISVSGVGGIEELEIDFQDHVNIICGPNAIGKTTILECISHLFSAGETELLKRNVNFDSSVIKAQVELDGSLQNIDVSFREFEPNHRNQINGRNQYAVKIISLKCSRTFDYIPLASVTKDPEKKSPHFWSEARNGVALNDMKNWFVNRYLYSAHKEALNEIQISNFELAKKCFTLIENGFSFSRVNASTNEIMVNTPNGEIYYEYLSSGFKSCISILFGAIKEIEYRFSDPWLKAEDFDGLILIDEIEIHLHPNWQSKIAKIISEIFPHSQIIATTHSPHVIQAANPKEIIALQSIENKVIKRELPVSEYGFQGWTIEEVLEDIMGMSDTRTFAFNSKIEAFNEAIEREDNIVANRLYNELDNLLHPQNHLKKLLRFQLASIREGNK